MINDRQQEQASLYALGALSDPERLAFEAEVELDAELRTLVFELQRTADSVALAVPQVELPHALKAKVLTRIGELATPPAVPRVSAFAGLQFLHAAAAADWKPLPVPGAYIKLLSFEKERSYAVLLGKLDPGARYPEHVNSGSEDFYILTGDLVVGGRKMVAGDFHHADAGSKHEVNYSEDGCTLIAVLTADDPLVAFAMA